VKNEKVSSWVVEPTEGAGLMAILKQLDVKLSQIPPATLAVHFGKSARLSARAVNNGLN